MTAPKISVVIPSALRFAPCGELWLTKALRSVATQTLQPIEVIVGVDPGQSRNLVMEAIGMEKTPFVTFAAYGTVKGHQAASNAACQQATGEWIAFIEDDDQWRPEHLETLYRVAEAHGVDFVTTSQVLIRDGREVSTFDFPTASGWLMRRSVWTALGGFDIRFKTHHDNLALAMLHSAGVKRIHVVEEDANLDRHGAPWADRSWLRNIAIFATVLRLGGLKRLTVDRTLHAESILAQNDRDVEKRQRAEDELAALRVLYQHHGW